MALDGRVEVYTKLLAATFRGVTFYVENVQTAGGRKATERMIVNSDLQVIDDTGLLQRTYSVSGYVSARYGERAIDNPTGITSTYEEQRIRLTNALEKRGPATLVHPIEGTITDLIAKSWSLDESVTESGVGRINIEFVRQVLVKDIIGPSVVDRGSGQSVEGSADQADATVLQAFKDKWNVSLSFIDSYSDGLGKVRSVYTDLTEINHSVRVKLDQVANMASQIDTAIANAPNIILSPQDLGNDISNILNATRDIYETSLDSFKAMVKLGDFGSLDIDLDTSTSGGNQRSNNNDAVNLLVRTMALTAAHRAALDLDLSTLDEISEIEESLEAQYQALIDTEDVPGDLLQDLEDLRSDLFNLFATAKLSARRVVSVMVGSTTPRLLAYLLYGDVDLDAALAALNSAESYELIAGELQVLTA